MWRNVDRWYELTNGRDVWFYLNIFGAILSIVLSNRGFCASLNIQARRTCGKFAGCGMNICVLSPSSFCPVMGWKLIFTMLTRNKRRLFWIPSFNLDFLTVYLQFATMHRNNKLFIYIYIKMALKVTVEATLGWCAPPGMLKRAHVIQLQYLQRSMLTP